MKPRFPHDALCRWDEPWWVSDFRPDDETMTKAAMVCAECPVLALCALDALQQNAQGQIRAGVHLPVRDDKNKDRWMMARRLLKNKAVVVDPDVSADAQLKPGRQPWERMGCGTVAACRAHYRRGEKPCQECSRAANRDKRERFAKYREARSG